MVIHGFTGACINIFKMVFMSQDNKFYIFVDVNIFDNVKFDVQLYCELFNRAFVQIAYDHINEN